MAVGGPLTEVGQLVAGLPTPAPLLSREDSGQPSTGDNARLSPCRSDGLGFGGHIRNCERVHNIIITPTKKSTKKGFEIWKQTYLNAGLSRLCSAAMASTSGPPSATYFASFTATCWVSSSTGGETLSSLSVLGLNSHSTTVLCSTGPHTPPVYSQ